MNWAYCSCGGQERGIRVDVLARTSDGKRPLGKPRRRLGIPSKLIFQK